MPRKRENYLHSGKRSEDRENVQVYGLIVRCQRWSREICKQQRDYCLVKVEGNYSLAARGGNLAKIPPNQVIDDFGRGSSVESESE